jgi:hypothetical protein
MYLASAPVLSADCIHLRDFMRYTLSFNAFPSESRRLELASADHGIGSRETFEFTPDFPTRPIDFTIRRAVGSEARDIGST